MIWIHYYFWKINFCGFCCWGDPQNQMLLALPVLLNVNSFWNDVDIRDALVLPACCSTGVCTFILKHTEIFFSIYRPKSEYSELEEDVRKYIVNSLFSFSLISKKLNICLTLKAIWQMWVIAYKEIYDYYALNMYLRVYVKNSME